MKPPRGRGPGVDIPPPLFFLAGFVVGMLLEKYVVDLLPESRPAVQFVVEAAGVALIVGGLGLAFWGMLTFQRAKTAIYPNRDASRLVRAGPYRLTRNPMYSGMTMGYLGGSLLLTAGWPFLTLPLSLLAIRRFVIDREERYLTSAFGDEYRAYQRQVRRWL